MMPGATYFNHVIEQMEAARARGELIEGALIIRRYLLTRDGICLDHVAIAIARTWMEDTLEGWVALKHCPPPGKAP